MNIILIDDDEDDFVHIRSVLADIKGGKYKLTWMPSFKKGIEALKTGGFDACLLDYRLGEKDGIDFLRESQKLGINCPIIFLTGHGDFDLDIQAMQVGAADYLVKSQISSNILEGSLRYAMKHALDLKELRDKEANFRTLF